FLDDLLVPPLETALALAEVDDVAVRVGEDLDLDVPGALDEPFEEEGVVTERRRRFATGGFERGGQILRVLDEAHALAATTGGRLDEHGIADFLGARDQFVVAQSGPGDAGHDGNA